MEEFRDILIERRTCKGEGAGKFYAVKQSLQIIRSVHSGDWVGFERVSFSSIEFRIGY